jgi:hypothetical protein
MGVERARLLVRHAAGHRSGPLFPGIDVPMLKTLSPWTALVIVVLSIAVDLMLGAMDPRTRTGGLP